MSECDKLLKTIRILIICLFVVGFVMYILTMLGLLNL